MYKDTELGLKITQILNKVVLFMIIFCIDMIVVDKYLLNVCQI